MQERHGRLPWLAPAELDAAQREVYDGIAGGARAAAGSPFPLVDAQGRLHGPFNAMLVSPTLGDALQRLGAAIRFGTSLDLRTREIAILEVARAARSDFEWYAHELVGRGAGLTDDELDALRHGRPAATFSAVEHAVHGATVALVRAGDLDDAAHARAVGALGEVALVELVALVGYYQLLALALRVHRTPLPAGAEAPAWPSAADDGPVTAP